MTRIPTQAEYEATEMHNAMARERKINAAPLVDRHEARAEFSDALKSPELVAERVRWLLDGNYGYGEMMRAQAIASNRRANRAANLGRLIAVYEWQCPADFATQAWKGLTPEQQTAVNAAIDAEVNRPAEE